MELEVVPSEWVKNMCKKIAHLTKVIYGLNVRLGDLDCTVEILKRNHEDQVHRLTSKLKYEIEQCKAKAKSEEVLLKETAQLRDKLQGENQLRIQAELNYSRLKEATELKKSKKISKLTYQIEAKKNEILQKLEELQKLQRQFDWDEEERCRCYSSEDSTSDQDAGRQKIVKQDIHAELHQEELRILKDKCNKTEQEKIEIIQSYETRLKAMRTLYEKFISSSTLLEYVGNANELITAKPSTGDQSADNTLANHDVVQKRVDELLRNLTQSEEQAERYRRTIRELKETLTAKEKQIDVMNEQMGVMKEDLARIAPRLRQTESSLAILRDNCSKQSEDILSKTYEIQTLQNTNEMLEATVTSLQSEVATLKKQLDESNLRNRELELTQSLLEATKELESVVNNNDATDPSSTRKSRVSSSKDSTSRSNDVVHAGSIKKRNSFKLDSDAKTDWEGRFNSLKLRIRNLIRTTDVNDERSRSDCATSKEGPNAPRALEG